LLPELRLTALQDTDLQKGSIQFDIDGTIGVNGQHQSVKQMVLLARNNHCRLQD
jgi:hypothetical protein